MTRELGGLLGAHVLVLVAGTGAASLLGVVRTRADLLFRLGVAYLAGLATVGIAAATVALVRVPFGWPALALLAVAGAAATLPAARKPGPARARRSRRDLAIAVAGAILLLGLLLRAVPAFVVTPIERYDAWAMWAMKGRALAELGWADPDVFAGEAYAGLNLAYPLLLPALEAAGFEAMGGFDPRAATVPFLFFGVALVAALGGLLHDLVPAWLLWPSLLAVAGAPAVSAELLTAYADVPLAAFLAVGCAAAARWLRGGEGWALALAALLFAAALLTKYEAPLFVLAAFAGLAGAELLGRRRLLPLAVAAVVSAVPLALWRVYVAVHELGTGHATGSTFHPGVVPIALEWLTGELFSVPRWGLLVPAFAAAVGLAGLAGSRALALFALAATALPLAALAVNYAVSSVPHALYLGATADRVVASIVLTGAALTPLLAAEALGSRPWRAASAPSAPEGARAGSAP